MKVFENFSEFLGKKKKTFFGRFHSLLTIFGFLRLSRISKINEISNIVMEKSDDTMRNISKIWFYEFFDDELKRKIP